MTPPLNATRRQVMIGATALFAAGSLPSVAASAQHATPDAVPPSPEEEAVGEALIQMATGFAMRDADLAASIYTDNAEWINAFGDTAVGREAIHAKLQEVFATDEFGAGELSGEPTGSVRILTDDTAVGWTYQEIEGQIDRGGIEIPLRKNHSLAVFIKQDGAWLITAHMFMDENIIG